MAKRPAHSLLFIKSDLIARADFGPSPEYAPMGFWEQPQTSNAPLHYSIEACMQLGGKCGRTVWVIGEPFWTQTLALPATALRGLSRDQIAKAIGFDVEALTGLSGSDSALGFSKAAPTDESEHLWVTQVPLASRTQIQTAVEAAGSRLAGIVHPGGLPTPMQQGLEGESSTRWRRVAVWRDVTFCQVGHGHEVHRLDIINGDPAQDVWRANVARWIASNNADHSEWLGPRGSMAGELLSEHGSPWTLLPPPTGNVLQDWLGKWLSTLISSNAAAAAVPIIEPRRAEHLQRQQLVVAAAITLFFLAGCLVRYAFLASDLKSLKAQQRVLSQQQADRMKTLKNLSGPRGLALPGHASPDFELERQRVNKLLAAVAGHASSDFIIDRISLQSDGGLLLEGKCLPNAAVDSFAEQLAVVLPVAGWSVSPAQKKPSGTVPSGEFSIRLTQLPLLQKKPAAEIVQSPLAGAVK